MVTWRFKDGMGEYLRELSIQQDVYNPAFTSPDSEIFTSGMQSRLLAGVPFHLKGTIISLLRAAQGKEVRDVILGLGHLKDYQTEREKMRLCFVGNPEKKNIT